jgi:hypothetical protein
MLASLVLATGCDIVFPLRAPKGDGVDDAGVDAFRPDADPSQPIGMFNISPALPITDRSATVTLHLAGDLAPRTVFYELESSAGSFAGSSTANGNVPLVSGFAEVSVPWTGPSSFTPASLTGRVSYDPAFTTFNFVTTLHFKVAEYFGHFGPNGGTRQFGADTLLAIQIEVGPGTGTAVKFGINGTGSGHAIAAIYNNDANDQPGARLAVFPEVQLSMTFPTELDISVSLAGKFWLAFIGDASIQLDANGTTTDPAPPVSVGIPYGSLPTMFPPGFATENGSWGLYVTVAP